MNQTRSGTGDASLLSQPLKKDESLPFGFGVKELSEGVLLTEQFESVNGLITQTVLLQNLSRDCGGMRIQCHCHSGPLSRLITVQDSSNQNSLANAVPSLRAAIGPCTSFLPDSRRRVYMTFVTLSRQTLVDVTLAHASGAESVVRRPACRSTLLEFPSLD